MSDIHVPRFSFSEIYSAAYVPVGTVYKVRSGGQTRKYVFLENDGADTMAAGDVAAVFTAASFTFGSCSVTAATEADYTDATTVRALVAGIAGAAIPLDSFGWFWFSGYGTHTITTDGNVAVYNGLICADGAKLATPNTSAATAHHAVFGISLAADSSTSLTKAVLGGPGMFPWDG